MNYPLHLKFKILAFGNKIYIRDNAGLVLMFAKQKIFKLKEEINVFGDEQQTQLKYAINADRIIDLSPRFTFTDINHQEVGSVQRHGMKSIWRASYEIVTPSQMRFNVSEENPWAKVFDSIFGQIPILNFLTGYLFHPSYIVKSSDNREIMRMKKQPSFWEVYFTIDKIDQTLKEQDENTLLLGLFTAVLLEKRRG